MSVIVKKDKKISVVVSLLGDSFSPDEFVSKFREIYPQDWGKVEKSYQEHERNTNIGEDHPMPKSTQYLKRALHAWQKKVEKNIIKTTNKNS